jgi:phospholipid transport system substrate-binding protein
MRGLSCGRRGFLAATAAVAVGAAVPARAAGEQAVIAPINRLIDGLLQIMKAGQNSSFQSRFDTLAPIVDQSFDLNAILQQSIGFTWAAIPDEQKTGLEQAFRRYTVSSYVNSFDSFNGQRFVVSPDTRPAGTAEQIVQTKIIPQSGDGHALDYVMRNIAGQWRAVDVLADGSISRVAVQRSDFRHLLAQGGPQALANSLKTKSTNLSDGTS